MFYKTKYTSQMGVITLACKDNKLAGLWFDGQKYFADSIKEEMQENDSPEIFHRTKDWLDRYFRGERPDIKELKLAPAGNEFRQTVWDLLCEIPYGKVTTYKALALKTAAKLNKSTMSAQAIGGAVGHNPISIIIPCHRVVSVDGNLTGYAGGLQRKIKLLELEHADISNPV